MAEKRASEVEGEEKVKTNPYDTLAFFFKRPCSEAVYKGPFRVRNKDEHRQLVERAKSEKIYLWYASVVQDEKGKYQAVPPHIVDFETVPDQPYDYVPPPNAPAAPVEPRYPSDLKCPKCGIKCNSTSGYTLHMKAHERDEQERAEKYPADLKCTVCGHKCNSTSGYTLHMKSHQADEAEAQEDDDDTLRCPHCKKKCSSTSGLTLHIKHNHPDKAD